LYRLTYNMNYLYSTVSLYRLTYNMNYLYSTVSLYLLTIPLALITLTLG